MSTQSPSTGRVIAVLNHLAERPDGYLTLAEISAGLGLSKATAHGLLTGLVQAGYVARHPVDKSYSLGNRLIAIGNAAIARHLDVVRHARVEMEMLGEQAAGQCIATRRLGDEVVVIFVIGTPTGPFGATIGYRAPFAPPFGMAYAAWLPENQLTAWLARSSLDPEHEARYREYVRVVRDRGFSLSTHGRVRERLEHLMVELLARRSEPNARDLLHAVTRRLAIEQGELAELDAGRSYSIRLIGAPVFDATGEVVMSLGLTGLPLVSGTTLRDLGYQLVIIARRLSDWLRAGTPELGEAPGTGR